MGGYAVALFLHISGALVFFAALGVEWTSLWQIRSAGNPEQVGGWLKILRTTTRTGFVSMLALVLAGIYMMATAWGNVAWLTVTLGALILVIALSLVLTRPRMAAIGRTLATEKGRALPAIHRIANSAQLWISIQTRVALALGIVLLKVGKPELGGSLLIIGVAVILGLVSALPMPQREFARGQSAS